MSRMRGITVLAILIALVSGEPAVANKVPHKGPAIGPVKDMGQVAGKAFVGKVIDGCANDGSGFVSGPGLGAPLLSKNKNLWFSVRAFADETPVNGVPSGVKSAFNPDVGSLRLCGKLGPTANQEGGERRIPCMNPPGSKPPGDTSCDEDVLRRQTKPGIGAACGVSKGYDGKGEIFFDPPSTKPTLRLRDVGWKASAGDKLTVVGKIWLPDANKGKAPPAADRFVAIIQVFGGGAACAEKRNNTPVGYVPKGNDNGRGATDFTFAGAYKVLNSGADLNESPGTCKEDRLDCMFGPKKIPDTQKFQP